MGNKVEIEKDIPLPAARNSYLVLDDLQPGESVTFPLANYLCVNHAYCYRQRRDGRRFTRRIEGATVRVWRTL